MDFRRNLRDAKPGRTYDEPGRRVFWPAFHFSLAVPPGCSIKAGQEGGLLQGGNESLVGWFTLHDAADWLVSNWMDEGIHHNDEMLVPVEPARTDLSAISRRFASTSFAGYKVQSDDAFRNGASTIFTGPSARAGELSELVTRYVRSVRFLQLQKLTEDQVTKALVGYLNVAVASSHELMQYIDLHFYMLRNEVMSTMRLLAEQAVREQNPQAERISPRWQVLQESRRLVDQGNWDKVLADLG